MKNILLLSILFIIVLPVLTKADPTDGSIRVTLQTSTISLDPGGIQDSQSWMVSRQVNCQLVQINPSFKSQILNCANTLICHRLNDQDSAETVSTWIGTRESFTVTAQLNMQQGEGGLGTVKRNREFIASRYD